MIIWKEKGQWGGLVPLLELPLIMKVLGKVAASAERGYNNITHEYNFLVQFHHLNNIEITKHFGHKLRINGVFSRDNLPQIKDITNVINLQDKNSEGTHWLSLFIDKNKIWNWTYSARSIKQLKTNQSITTSLEKNLWLTKNVLVL